MKGEQDGHECAGLLSVPVCLSTTRGLINPDSRVFQAPLNPAHAIPAGAPEHIYLFNLVTPVGDVTHSLTHIEAVLVPLPFSQLQSGSILRSEASVAGS